MKKISTFLFAVFTSFSWLLAQTWNAQTTNSQDFLSSITMWNAQTGWAFGQTGTILFTQNGGTTWTDQGFSPNLDLRGSYAFSTTSIIAVGKYDPTGGGVVIRSSNGGQTWTADSSSFIERLNDVSFGDAQTGWAVGREGYIIKTTNAGQSWIPQTGGVDERLFAVHFIDNMNGWAAGRKGTIIKTTNGGTSWQPLTTGDDPDFEDVFFTDAQTGWLVGEEGLILKTTNGGTTWATQTSGVTVDLFAVEMTDSQTGWVGGTGGLVLHTTNGGQTWTTQPSAATQDVYDFSMISGSPGWLCAGLGQISKYGTTTGGAVVADFSTDTQICLGDSSHFTDLSTGPTASWSWDFGDGHSSNLTSPGYLYQQGGTYPVSLIVGDGTGNADTFQVTVFVSNPVIQVNPTSAVICAQGDTASFQATGAASYMWSPSTGLSSATGSQVFAFPNLNTSYTVIGTDSIGCHDTTSVTVTIDSTSSPTADFSVSEDLLCGAAQVQFVNQSSFASSYQWIFPGTLPGFSNDPAPSVDFSTPGSYDVSLIAKGCLVNDTIVKTGVIELLPPVTAAFSASTDTLMLSQGNQVSFTNQSINASDWFWDFDNGQTDMGANPTATYQQAGNYTVTLLAFEDICSDTATMELVVLGASSLESQLTNDQINIYTDFIAQTLKIEWKTDLVKPYTVSLFNLEGKRILTTSSSMDKTQQISLKPFSSGVYLVQIAGPGQILFLKKIIK